MKTAIAEMNAAEEVVKKHIYENARYALDQTEYRKRHDELSSAVIEAKERAAIAKAEIESRKARKLLFDEFISTAKKLKAPLTDFDEQLWGTLVEYMEVGETIRFVFKNGIK